MATGTRGNPVTGPQEPDTAGSLGPLSRISAAELQGPRCPASLRATSRTYRAETVRVKVAVFAVASSFQWPLATGASNEVPSRLVETAYVPMRPFAPVWRG